MSIVLYPVHHALAPFIQSFVHVQIAAVNKEEPLRMDFYPHGYSALIFNLDANSYVMDALENKEIKASFRFCGQFDTYSAYKCLKANFLIINFNPYGAHFLLGLEQREFLNAKVEITDIFPNLRPIVNRLEDEGTSVQNIVTHVEQWLLKKLSQNKISEYARYQYITNLIQTKSGNYSIKELSSQVGMSISSLEDHFQTKVGLTPKMFSRIIRFNECIRFIELNKANGLKWSEIAYRFNYFDQTHFIREFKRFYGYTPSKLEFSEWNISKIITS